MSEEPEKPEAPQEEHEPPNEAEVPPNEPDTPVPDKSEKPEALVAV